MSEQAQDFCRRVGLLYVSPSELQLCRRRCGKGFKYLNATGTCIRDKTIKTRIMQLAIPPAWVEVRIAEDSRAHIQAVGRDAEGRLQYRYHPDWDAFGHATKAERLKRFGAALPRLRRAVRAALAAPGLSRKKIVAAVVRLIDRSLLRPGYEEYARKDGGRGAATLLSRDVSIEGDRILLDFAGKGGKEIKQELRDPLLARVLQRLRRNHGRRLFSAPGADGKERPVTAKEVNTFLIEAGGEPISAKDFRTFKASAAALARLAVEKSTEAARARKQALIAAADEASRMLANTRSVARSSYIHPSVIKAYEAGRLEAHLLGGRIRQGLTRAESAFLQFLEKPRARR
jgi:DNA topoisomerase-1